MSFLCRHVTVHFADFLIFVTFRTKVIKVTTSNTKNFMGILAFILQILNVLVYWTMSFLRRISLYCFATSSYLLPLNQGFQSHNFKHKEPQGYSDIYLTDIYSSGSLDDVLPLQTCYSTFCRLPHICYIQNQGYQSHYFKHKELYGYSCIYFTDIECSGLLDNVIPTQNFTVLFRDFLILVTSKPRFSKSLLQTQKSRVFQHLSYRHVKIWFIGQCHFFAYMLRYTYTTYSYLLPLKPRFSMSLLQTRGT